MADASESDDPESGQTASPDRRVLGWFFALAAAIAVCLVWSAFRNDAPELLRAPLDFSMNAAAGVLLAYVGFRTLFLYQFRTEELLVIVLLLSLGMKYTVDLMRVIDTFGLAGNSAQPARLFPACLLTASVLLLGAAFGLRNCRKMKLQNRGRRVLRIVSGTLALPAAAGCFVFPCFVLMAALSEETEAGLVCALLWLASLIVTGVNARGFIDAMAVTDEIKSKERMP